MDATDDEGDRHRTVLTRYLLEWQQYNLFALVLLHLVRCVDVHCVSE